jgi:hypothetical protein
MIKKEAEEVCNRGAEAAGEYLKESYKTYQKLNFK